MLTFDFLVTQYMSTLAFSQCSICQHVRLYIHLNTLRSSSQEKWMKDM
jgi:hypothetical protein